MRFQRLMNESEIGNVRIHLEETEIECKHECSGAVLLVGQL